MSSRHIAPAALVLGCAAAALVGGYLAIRAFATTVESFTLGTVRATAIPARDGRVDLYVPIVDWGIRADPYRAPVAVELRFRSLDREEARAALRSSPAARARLESIRRDLERIGRDALERAALLGLAGGLVGGLLAGGLIGAALHRRRWLFYGAGAGVAAPLAFAIAVLATLRTIDYEAFERPTFYAHGRELPRLLAFSDQLRAAGDTYTRSYEQALAGLANLVAFAGDGAAEGTTSSSLVLVSDLHANTLVLSVLDEYSRTKTVVLAGDMTLLGADVETGLVPRLARLGETVVAVSGNHDSRPFMTALARAGVVVLTRRGRLRPDGTTDGRQVVELDGLGIAGYDDPLEGPSGRIEARPLELTDRRFAEEAQAFVSWFGALPRRPDVVIVHQHGLAHALLDTVRPDDPPLLIMTGHDHKQHLERDEAAVLVDGGTAGAGGPFAIGEQRVGFAEVRFTDGGVARTVDLIEVEPLSGDAVARRISIEDGD